MADMQIVPAGKNVEAQYVEMMVPLYSYGCEGEVKKALANLKGIYSVNVDFYQQKVTVWGICNKYDVLNTIKKKRKQGRFWNDQDDVQLEDSISAPPPSLHPNRSKPYLDMIKERSFSMKAVAMMKDRSLSWATLKKAFIRSNSF